VGIAIGDQVLDVAEALDAELLEGTAAEACDAPDLNPLLSLDAEDWTELRHQVSALLAEGSDAAPAEAERARILVAQDAVEMLLPMEVGDYTDFYASIHHATNVGSMFRPDNPLLPNYKWIPIGYHGRASSVVVSGTPVRRPVGQRKAPDGGTPTWGPAPPGLRLEVGCVVGTGNELGDTIPLAEAERHMFGLCLLNDWSARDLQAWEYQPLGPFLAKSFAIHDLALDRDPGCAGPLPHPGLPAPRRRPGSPPLPAGRGGPGGGGLRPDPRGAPPHPRHAGAGRCALPGEPGELPRHVLDPGPDAQPPRIQRVQPPPRRPPGKRHGERRRPRSRGCLLERTWRGSEPLELPGGETRKFLEDGDEVILRWVVRGSGKAPDRIRVLRRATVVRARALPGRCGWRG
jgi:fumarylacetoacetase